MSNEQDKPTSSAPPPMVFERGWARKGGANVGPSQVTTRPPPPAPLIQPGPKKDE